MPYCLEYFGPFAATSRTSKHPLDEILPHLISTMPTELSRFQEPFHRTKAYQHIFQYNLSKPTSFPWKAERQWKHNTPTLSTYPYIHSRRIAISKADVTPGWFYFPSIVPRWVLRVDWFDLRFQLSSNLVFPFRFHLVEKANENKRNPGIECCTG